MPKPPTTAQEVADRLAQRIRSGEMAPGTWLPPERQLAETYGVGRNTVRKAVTMLISDGLAESLPGTGTRVASPGEPAAARSVVDAGDVHAELTAIRAELEKIGARLSAIEERTGTSEGAR
jgi:DNA-binding FadR family transcriptional regulator